MCDLTVGSANAAAQLLPFQCQAQCMYLLRRMSAATACNVTALSEWCQSVSVDNDTSASMACVVTGALHVPATHKFMTTPALAMQDSIAAETVPDLAVRSDSAWAV